MEIFNLDMTPSTVTPNAHAGQYDASRTVRFMLKNGGVPFTLAGTETITAEITRSDNTEVTINVANTSSNYVDVVFDDTVCTVKGLYACELRLKDSNGFDIGSKNFALLVQRDPYDGTGVNVETVGPADICTFETTLPEPLQSVIVDVEATGGNGTPDNPNPITGYSSANITRCGKNIFNYDLSDATNIIKYVQIKTGNGTFTMSSNIPLVEGAALLFFLSGYQTSGGSTAVNGVSNGIPRTVTTTDGYVTFAYRYYGTPIIYPAGYNTQIEKGSTETAYEPYNGQTYTIAFGQTVYGGQLDVTRGKLHVTHGKYTLDNTATAGQFDINTYADRNRLSYVPYQSDGKTNGTFKADKLETIPNAPGGIGTDDYQIFGSTTAPRMWITVPTTIATVADFLTYISSNPIDVVYELATPFNIDLTPEVISVIVGENNVFADCGQTTVKYLKEGV